MSAPPFEPDERLLPSGPAGELADAEGVARYLFAARFAAERSVLDAGCGIGEGSVRLARAGARAVLGLDVSRHAIAEATRRASAAEAASLRFEHGDLLAGELPAGSFGLVACFGVLDEVADPERACDELVRFLGEDGLLIASSGSEEVRAAIAVQLPHSLELTQAAGLATLIAPEGETRMDGEIDRGPPDPENSASAAPARIVMAARRPIDPPAALSVHARYPEVGGWMASIADWERRARRAEAELAATQIELGYMNELLADLSSRRKRGVIRSRFGSLRG